MLKRLLLLLIVALSLPVLFSFVKEKKQKIVRTIIVDAGHGIMPNGGYNGAAGKYSYEDQVCLAVAKILVAQLKDAFPDATIIETRPTDKLVPLHRRAEIANENKGDLFISIHCNSAPAIRHSEPNGFKTVTSYVGKGKKKRKVTRKVQQYRYYTTPNPATGTETYIWGAHRNDDKEVAMRENAPMMSEENYKENYGDIDPNSPEFIAVSLLKTKQYFKRSATLAGLVQDEFVNVGRINRGQRQRPVGIWVLQATAMPSILVETGFISNPSDEDYLNSKSGQKEIATCVTNSVKNYIGWLEKSQIKGGQNENTDTKNLMPTSSNTKSFLDRVDKKEKKLLVK